MNPVFEAIADYFFPPVCILCGGAGNSYLCEECEKLLSGAFEPGKAVLNGGMGYIDEAFYAFRYRDPYVQDIIFQMKKDNIEGHYIAVAPFVKKALEKSGFTEKCDVAVFSPRKVMAKRKHCVDQAEELAKSVSEMTGIPLSRGIKRRSVSFTQHKLPVRLRRINARGKFRAVERFDGQNVLLIDDVITTGSTLNEIAHVLKKHGAMKVFVFTLAH